MLVQVLLIDDLADTCFTLLNAVTQLVRVGGARAVYVFVTHAVMSQMPQVWIVDKLSYKRTIGCHIVTTITTDKAFSSLKGPTRHY